MYWARCEKHNQSLLRGIPITSTPKSSALFFTRVFTLSLYGVSFSFWLTMWNFRNSHFTKNRKSAFCRFEPESRHQEVYIFTGWADYFFSQNSWDWFSVFSPPYHIMRWFWCCYFESSLPVSMDIFFLIYRPGWVFPHVWYRSWKYSGCGASCAKTLMRLRGSKPGGGGAGGHCAPDLYCGTVRKCGVRSL